MQSLVPILRAICSTRDPLIVVALLRDPEQYYDGNASDMLSREVIHSPLWENPYHAISDLPGPRTIDALLDQIQSSLVRVRQIKPGARTTVLFDSLQPISDSPRDGVSGAVRLVQGVLALMQTSSNNPLTNAPQTCEGRVVAALMPDSDLSSRTERLVATLQSPSLWYSSPTVGTTSSSAGQGTTSVSYMLPSQFAKVIQDDYAQRLPLTPTPASARDTLRSEYEDEHQDPRVWPLISALTSRGTLGRPDQPGWWASLSPQTQSSLEAAHSSPRKASNPPDSTSDTHHIAALLVSFSCSGQGKAAEEVVGISISSEASEGHVTVVPLTHEVLDELQPPPVKAVSVSPLAVTNRTNAPLATASHGPEGEDGNTHAALLAGLPFNLNETASQRAQRAQVVLPHHAAQQVAQQALGSGQSSIHGRGSILFHPEAVDDADEEEVDEDEEI